MTRKADSNGGLIDFELLFKQVGGIAVLLYAPGILTVNSYLYKLGVSDFELHSTSSRTPVPRQNLVRSKKNILITLSSSRPSEHHARIERAFTLCWHQPI